jgi:hypothetical protein
MGPSSLRLVAVEPPNFTPELTQVTRFGGVVSSTSRANSAPGEQLSGRSRSPRSRSGVPQGSITPKSPAKIRQAPIGRRTSRRSIADRLWRNRRPRCCATLILIMPQGIATKPLTCERALRRGTNVQQRVLQHQQSRRDAGSHDRNAPAPTAGTPIAPGSGGRPTRGPGGRRGEPG